MSEKILFVDDDAKILKAYQRQLGEQFNLDTALGPEAGLQAVAEQGPFAVIVSDMRMPGMDGVQFLTQVREISSNSVRMMLTGYADIGTAVQAINEGSIFRFLSKPCSADVLARAVTDALDQYRLVMAEKDLLENTLRGSVKVLTEVLSLVNPVAFGRASRILRLVRQMGEKLEVEHLWQLEIATMLSHLGCVTVPEDTLERAYRGQTLSPDEQRILQDHPIVAQNLLANIPRLELVAEMIAYQGKCFDGSGFPRDDRLGEDIPVGARILKVALDFDTHESRGLTPINALQQLKKRADLYDPLVLQACESVLDSLSVLNVREVYLAELTDGMILAADVTSPEDQLFVTKGQEITSSVRKRLRNLGDNNRIREPLVVYEAAARAATQLTH